MLKFFFVMLILLTGCVKDYNFNPTTSVLKWMVTSEKK
jgi:hypothetical protein